MPEKTGEKLDAFYWHEALDRTCTCVEMVDSLILFHPAIERAEALKAKAEKAHQLLYELYQEIAGVIANESDN